MRGTLQNSFQNPHIARAPYFETPLYAGQQQVERLEEKGRGGAKGELFTETVLRSVPQICKVGAESTHV